MKKRFVVWDYDNTLADSVPCLVQSHQEVCQSYDIPLWDPRDVLKYVGGYGENTRWPIYLPDDKQEEALQRYHQRCLINSPKMVKLFPCVKDILSLFKEKGAMQVIASHKNQEELSADCDRLGITPFMQEILGVQMPNPPKDYIYKPHRNCVAHLLDKYLPDEIIVIGDGLSDMKLAENLGAFAILIHPELLSETIQYDKYFQTHESLFNFLKEYLND